MYTPRTLIALQEATIRSTRSGEDAFARAALGARMSPGQKATVYRSPKGEYSYGIKSKSTGGKAAPKGSQAVGEVTPGVDGPWIRRQPKKGRMKKQLARIARSAHLGDEERERYAAAAKAKEGRHALPAGAQAAVKRATYGVDPRRKAADFGRGKPSVGSRTVGALRRLGGAMKDVAARMTGRKRVVA